MSPKIELMKEKKDFNNAWELINNSFDIHKELPNQVFNQKYSNFLFEEFDEAMSADFWNSQIKPLMLVSQDTHILVAVLDPNPVNYFYSKYACYNFAKFPASITGHDYWETLETGPKENPANCILTNSETVVWLPLSAKWAICGERSFGICVLAFENDEVRLAADSITKKWNAASFALQSFVSNNFKNRIVPKEFFYSIMRNYPNKCRENTRCFLCLSESSFGSNFCQKHAEELKHMLGEKTNLVENPGWEHHCRLCGASEGSKIIRYKNRGPGGPGAYEYCVYFCDKDILKEYGKYQTNDKMSCRILRIL